MNAHSIALPEDYEKRYVAAWTVAMLPPAGVLLTLVWIMRPQVLPGVVLLMTAFVATMMLFLRRLAVRSRTVTEACGYVPSQRRRPDLSLPSAVLVVGAVNALIKGDWRWILIAVWVGAIIGCGLVLRWLILDRWLRNQMNPGGFK